MIIYDNVRSYVIIYDHLWSYMMIYDHVWSCVIIYHHIWSYIMIYDHIWSYIIIYHHIWSCMMYSCPPPWSPGPRALGPGPQAPALGRTAALNGMGGVTPWGRGDRWIMSGPRGDYKAWVFAEYTFSFFVFGASPDGARWAGRMGGLQILPASRQSSHRLLCDTTDMYAVWHSRHGLLCYIADMSAVPHSRHVCCFS